MSDNLFMYNSIPVNTLSIRCKAGDPDLKSGQWETLRRGENNNRRWSAVVRLGPTIGGSFSLSLRNLDCGIDRVGLA